MAAPSRTPQRKRPRDRGSLSVELALFAPVVVLLIALGLLADRASTTMIDLHTAARAAARAASIERTAADAQAAASDVAEAMRPDRCADYTAQIDTADLEPGSAVTVTLTCTTGSVAFFGARTETVTSRSPIDQWRSGGETS